MARDSSSQTSRKVGTVYWITGLAGAGKSTIGRRLAEYFKATNPAVVFMDGDVLREVLSTDLGYAREERRVSAFRNARLCKVLSDQGIDVVCATISMFHEVRKWNRENIPNYREVYVRAPLEVLKQRNQKNLYAGTSHGVVRDVAGVDQSVELPDQPDVIIDNDGTFSPEVVVHRLLQALGR